MEELPDFTCEMPGCLETFYSQCDKCCKKSFCKDHLDNHYSVDTDVLAFWKANQFNYPTLAAMAKDYLTVQASSVPSERAFSTGVDLVTPDRCSLTGETIEKAQFLKFHL